MSEPGDDGAAGTARPRLIGKRWRGIAAAVVAAAIGVAAMVGLSRPAAQSSRYAIVEDGSAAPAPPQDPLRAELTRCRTLPANTDDAACHAVWEVNRRRFFGESRSLIVPPRPAAPARGDAATDTIPHERER